MSFVISFFYAFQSYDECHGHVIRTRELLKAGWWTEVDGNHVRWWALDICSVEPLHFTVVIFVCMLFTVTWLEHLTLCFVFLFQTLLPRGQNPNLLRDRNTEVNRLVHSKVSAVPKCEIVEINKGFIQPDGTISHHDMHDYLHLTNSGYSKAFEPVYELLLQLLSEGETEKDLTPSE